MRSSINIQRSVRPALALAGATLWGVIELLALWRSRWMTRGRAKT